MHHSHSFLSVDSTVKAGTRALGGTQRLFVIGVHLAIMCADSACRLVVLEFPRTCIC
jgi:hypothetical protein